MFGVSLRNPNVWSSEQTFCVLWPGNTAVPYVLPFWPSQTSIKLAGKNITKYSYFSCVVYKVK